MKVNDLDLLQILLPRLLFLHFSHTAYLDNPQALGFLCIISYNDRTVFPGI